MRSPHTPLRRTGPGGGRRRPGHLRSAAAIAAALALLSACEDGDPFGDTAPVDQQDEPGEPADPPEQDGDAAQAIASDLFDRVNDEREARGLDPVEWDDELAAMAEEWSEVMVDDGFEHRDLNPELFEDRLSGFVGVGENIFTSSAPVPAGQTHIGWMHSPGHRANILDPSWDRLGIGVHCADDGRVYATQNFGRTLEAGPGDFDPERTPPPEEPVARDDVDSGPSC